MRTAMLSFSSPGSPKTSTGRLLAKAVDDELSAGNEVGRALDRLVRRELQSDTRTVPDRAQLQPPVLEGAWRSASCL